jgi:hypothetical protein
MTIGDIFNDLAGNASGNYKLELLKSHENNDLLKRCIRMALDPLTNFYQKKIPKYVPSESATVPLSDALDMLEKLSDRTYTGNEAIAYLKRILETCQEPKVIERIIAKDLKCGVQEKTANKIWPGLVLDYPCMLCSPISDKLLAKIKYPAYVQLKMDGMRVNIIVTHRNGEGRIEFRSRNGKELSILGNFDQEFLSFSNGQDVVFDGELLWMTPDGIANRQTGNGIIAKTIKGTISLEESNGIHAVLWDVIDYRDFLTGRSDVKYENRFKRLNLFEVDGRRKRISIVKSHIVNSPDDIHEIYQGYIDDHEEGVILKDMSGSWENNRVQHQLKLKAELECDLKVVGIKMGKGRMVDVLGALSCESSDGVVKVSVGSGFSDEQRVELLTDTVGKIVTVKYNARIGNKKSGNTLFLPVFVKIRDDKDVADTDKMIK